MKRYFAFGEYIRTLRLQASLTRFGGICRGIEAVITGLTRNFVVTLEPPTLNPLIYKGFPQFKYNLIA